MLQRLDARRYLTNFDSARAGHVITDVLVIGSGVAGARAAIEAAGERDVILVTKGSFEQSSTSWAQGGIAAALGPADSAKCHLDDTMRVGCGLCVRAAVEVLVNEGPRRIAELISWGFEADRDGSDLALAREGGHSLHRVIHAQGDQTGRVLSDTLEKMVQAAARLRVFDHCYVIDLLTIDGVCRGAVTYHPKYGHQLIWARRTILASGGCGQLWRETTNPSVVTGDGLAAALRAGARLRDMEMMQFHPTTLYVAGAGRALISEAVRGEGAYLVDKAGGRFMRDFHADMELAPRDVVSRAIHAHLIATRANCVFLDVRHLKGFAERFPQIARLCRDFQIDVTTDLIPVRPSAHYLVGGVEVDLDGQTSVPGLLCCGEASSTGVHGANRMASNSLLEGLVYGARAGQTAADACGREAGQSQVFRAVHEAVKSQRTTLDLPDIRNSLRSVMWRNVGIVRDAERLRETCDILKFWGHYTLDKTFDEPDGWELQNMVLVAHATASSALERRESLGVHFRTDAPVGEKPLGDKLYHLITTREGVTRAGHVV